MIDEKLNGMNKNEHCTSQAISAASAYNISENCIRTDLTELVFPSKSYDVPTLYNSHLNKLP